MSGWQVTEVKWTYGYLLKVRTDGTRWQISVNRHIPIPQGPLDKYLEELKLSGVQLDDPVLDCWIQEIDGLSELMAEISGWRDATVKETERIQRNLKK